MFPKKSGLVAFAVLLMFASASSAFATDTEKEGDAKLLKALSLTKLSLIAGIEQAAAKSPEAAISAKFELEDGKLSLSVYTAGKGLTVAAESNVLKEFAGSPEAAKWAPEVEVFKDVEHVSRAAEQLTLVALTKVKLIDVIKKAEKDEPGMVFSITPVLQNRKPVFVVLVAVKTGVVELRYDLMTGKKLAKAKK